MKKPKKFKKSKLSKLPPLKRPVIKGASIKSIKRPFKRPVKSAEEKLTDALSTVPRITNETVADHREEVLSSARKYIYPLQHSKHSVVRISLSLLAVVILGFFAVTGLELYKFRTTSGFMYDVTRIIPFPVAKVGRSWISYDAYLFELRHNMHYYQTQQQADFTTKDGQVQLTRLRQQAMAQVIQDAYVKQLAAQHHVTVSGQAVDNEISLLKVENRLGSSNQGFNTALQQYFGWNVTDLKRELAQELLQQAVVARLDTATNARAQSALQQLAGGANFATLASQVSDDAATKTNGGQYPDAITINDGDLPPALTAELFELKPGQVSAIINTGYTLDIVKVLDASGGSGPDGTTNPTSLHAAHIQFTFQPITTYTKPLQAKEPAREYIKS
jgi:hypothetical protein